MSQKPNAAKLVGLPITVVHKATPYAWTATDPDNRVHPLDPSTRFVGEVPKLALVEWKDGIMLPVEPAPPRYFDGFAIREHLMRLRNEVECLEFLNQYGRFSKLQRVDSDVGWTLNALMKWQEVFAELAKRGLEQWNQYATSLMTPGHKSRIRAVLGALNSTENSIEFRPNNLGLWSVKGAKYIAAIETGDVVSTIITTLQVDHVRGAKFGACARNDCPRFYEITSKHKRKYCGPDCAHLETVRRLRRRRKAKSRPNRRRETNP